MLIYIKYATVLLCIELYDELNIELSVNYIQQVCCTVSLPDKKILMLNEVISLRCSLSETEENLLYYYVVFKELLL